MKVFYNGKIYSYFDCDQKSNIKDEIYALLLISTYKSNNIENFKSFFDELKKNHKDVKSMIDSTLNLWNANNIEEINELKEYLSKIKEIEIKDFPEANSDEKFYLEFDDGKIKEFNKYEMYDNDVNIDLTKKEISKNIPFIEINDLNPEVIYYDSTIEIKDEYEYIISNITTPKLLSDPVNLSDDDELNGVDIELILTKIRFPQRFYEDYDSKKNYKEQILFKTLENGSYFLDFPKDFGIRFSKNEDIIDFFQKIGINDFNLEKLKEYDEKIQEKLDNFLRENSTKINTFLDSFSLYHKVYKIYEKFFENTENKDLKNLKDYNSELLNLMKELNNPKNKRRKLYSVFNDINNKISDIKEFCEPLNAIHELVKEINSSEDNFSNTKSEFSQKFNQLKKADINKYYLYLILQKETSKNFDECKKELDKFKQRLPENYIYYINKSKFNNVITKAYRDNKFQMFAIFSTISIIILAIFKKLDFISDLTNIHNKVTLSFILIASAILIGFILSIVDKLVNDTNYEKLFNNLDIDVDCNLMYCDVSAWCFNQVELESLGNFEVSSSEHFAQSDNLKLR